MKSCPVLIVSAFGRGQSLAARLKEQDIPVTLLEVSEGLGASAPEDEEGPFGFFSSHLAKTFLERLHQDDPPRSQIDGWTFVLSSGPFEMKSPLTKYRLEKLGLAPGVLETLREIRDGKVKSIAPWSQAGINQSWLIEISASLAANALRFYPDAMTSGNFLPLEDDFWVRPVTRPGINQSLDWCERLGVAVERNLVVKDLAREGRRALKGLEYGQKNSTTTEIFNFEHLVWCLSSEETQFLSPQLSEKIFPAGSLKPAWVWTRFRLRLAACPERDALPFHSVWIGQLDLPWTHENCLILQKSPSPDLLDAWIRIPSEQRLQKAYLNDRLAKILEILSRRFVSAQPHKAEDISVSQNTYREVGPSRQPLFDPKALLNWRTPFEENLSLHSPEVWSGLGWNFMMKHEEKVLAQVTQWWSKREELRLKKELKGRN